MPEKEEAPEEERQVEIGVEYIYEEYLNPMIFLRVNVYWACMGDVFTTI